MRVICNIPNGSDEISGVKFGPQESGQRVSEEISDEQGQRFLSVKGFSVYVERQPEAPQSVVPSAEAHAQEGGEDGGSDAGDDGGDGEGHEPDEQDADETEKTGDQEHDNSGDGIPDEPAGQGANPDAARPAKKKKKK